MALSTIAAFTPLRGTLPWRGYLDYHGQQRTMHSMGQPGIGDQPNAKLSVLIESVQEKARTKPLFARYVEDLAIGKFRPSQIEEPVKRITQGLGGRPVINSRFMWSFSPIHRKIDRVLKRRGHTDYISNGRVLVRETSHRIFAVQMSGEAMEACLRLAFARFGSIIHAFGSDEFKKRLASTAGRMNSPCVFADDALERIRSRAARREPTKQRMRLSEREV